MKTSTYIVTLAAALIIAAVVAYVSGRRDGIASVQPVAAKSDTTYIPDTTRPKPKEIIRTVTKKEYFPVTDTLRIKDTVYLPLPRVRKVYADSNYRAVVSGVLPSLDSIEIYRTNKVVTQYVEVKDPRKVCSVPTVINVGVLSAAAAAAAVLAAMHDK